MYVCTYACECFPTTPVHDESLHCAWGLISRAGWSVIDDSDNYALSSDYWWAGRNPNAVDIYLYVAVLFNIVDYMHIWWCFFLLHTSLVFLIACCRVLFSNAVMFRHPILL